MTHGRTEYPDLKEKSRKNAPKSQVEIKDTNKKDTFEPKTTTLSGD
jgi:hypothetical protein